jgi:hypothetical protein
MAPEEPPPSDQTTGPHAGHGLSRGRRPPAARHRILRALIFVVVLGLPASWIAYDYLIHSARAPQPADALTVNAVGRWWNISGDRYLALEWEGQRAWLRDYTNSDSGVVSAGSWRTAKDIVIVHVTGDAGELTQELELVGNDAEMFLAPAPAARARLLDSWIADHDDDDEDMSPPGSTAREVHAARTRYPHGMNKDALASSNKP